MDKEFKFVIIALVAIFGIIAIVSQKANELGYQSGYAGGLSEGRQQISQSCKQSEEWKEYYLQRLLQSDCQNADFDFTLDTELSLLCCRKTDKGFLYCEEYVSAGEVKNILPENITIVNTDWGSMSLIVNTTYDYASCELEQYKDNSKALVCDFDDWS